jgi:hypothetical protein
MDNDALIAAISRLWRPGNFYVGNGLRCAWQFETTQAIPWELFRGTLVESSRAPVKTFLAWNLLPVEDGQIGADPLISVLLAETERQIHVTRGYLVYAQEVDAGLETHEVQRWTRELVGTLTLADFDEKTNVSDEIDLLIRLAVLGTSRLPLTSVESPHPAFSFGQLLYEPGYSDEAKNAKQPMRHWSQLIVLDQPMSPRTLETILRAVRPDEIENVPPALCGILGGVPLNWIFNDVSLSPYTDFVDNTLAVMAGICRPEAELDLLGRQIRVLCRHLTAYDLVQFHHRGANYPDALFLDALLRRFLELAEGSPELMREDVRDQLPPRRFRQDRLRRRALRQGILFRRRYEGHAVPDAPTSPGENVRVLPAPHVRLSDEQIEQPARRRRRLFAEAPTIELIPKSLLPLVAQSLRDLDDPRERREAGTALFIDRPLGYHKLPAEVDGTPLLSYVAFSRNLAVAGLRQLAGLTAALGIDAPIPQETEGIAGLSVDQVPESRRPAVSLADARRVSGDFRILRTTDVSANWFWRATVDWLPVPVEFLNKEDLSTDVMSLIVRTRTDDGGSQMTAYDAVGRLRLEFEADLSEGFATIRGVEVPRAGIVFSNIRDENGEVVVRDARVRPPR